MELAELVSAVNSTRESVLKQQEEVLLLEGEVSKRAKVCSFFQSITIIVLYLSSILGYAEPNC